MCSIRIRVVALAAVLLVAGIAAAAEPGNLAATLPARTPHFEPLSGKVLGILSPDTANASIRERRVGPEDAVGFASGRVSDRWVYVPALPDASSVESLLVAVGKDGKETKRFEGLEFLRQSGLRSRGLAPDYQLVEVEVNGGAGSPAQDVLVATRITPKEGTPEFPLRVGEKVAELRTRFTEQLRTRDADIRAALARQQAKVFGDKSMTGPRETADQTHVTWLPESESLLIEFQHVVTDGRYSWSEGIVPKVSVSKPGTRYGTTIGVSVTDTYTVDKNGKVLSEKVNISPFTHTTPPPATMPHKKRG